MAQLRYVIRIESFLCASYRRLQCLLVGWLAVVNTRWNDVSCWVFFFLVDIFINVFLCANEFVLLSSWRKANRVEKREIMLLFYYLSLYTYTYRRTSILFSSLTVKMDGKKLFMIVSLDSFQLNKILKVLFCLDVMSWFYFFSLFQPQFRRQMTLFSIKEKNCL